MYLHKSASSEAARAFILLMSQLTPTKKLSLSRLGLMGAVVGARMRRYLSEN